MWTKINFRLLKIFQNKKMKTNYLESDVSLYCLLYSGLDFDKLLCWLTSCDPSTSHKLYTRQGCASTSRLQSIAIGCSRLQSIQKITRFFAMVGVGNFCNFCECLRFFAIVLPVGVDFRSFLYFFAIFCKSTSQSISKRLQSIKKID